MHVPSVSACCVALSQPDRLGSCKHHSPLTLTVMNNNALMRHLQNKHCMQAGVSKIPSFTAGTLRHIHQWYSLPYMEWTLLAYLFGEVMRVCQFIVEAQGLIVALESIPNSCHPVGVCVVCHLGKHLQHEVMPASF